MSSPGLAFALGIGCLLAGFLLRVGLDPFLEKRATYIFFVPGVILAAIGGRWPALLMALLGAAAGLLADRITGDVRFGDCLAASVFLLIGIVVSAGGESLRRLRQREAKINADLTRREAHLTSILRTVPSAMVVIDAVGRIQDFSDTAVRMFGWERAEAVGQNVSILMPSPHREHHDEYLGRYLSTRQSNIIGKSATVSGQRKDGTIFPLELWIGEMKLAEGTFFTGFARDLTERRETEARMQEMQSELLHMSRLTALGEMASALAHELNQPLSAISNYITGSRRLLMNDGAPATKVTDALDRAAQETQRAGDIIRHLRDFVSRGETDRSLEDLTLLIRETAALAFIGSREREVTAAFDLDPALDPVLIDKVQIQQVLLNLIRNAADAMASSEKRSLVISTGRQSPDLAVISVQDTGEGISEAVMNRLFQPFVTTKRTGLGVGLSICRTIIEAHGGRIWAEANPRGGTIMRFTVPTVSEQDLHHAG